MTAMSSRRRADPRVFGLRCRDVGTGSLLHQVARYEGEIVQARLASLTTLVTASGTTPTRPAPLLVALIRALLFWLSGVRYQTARWACGTCARANAPLTSNTRVGSAASASTATTIPPSVRPSPPLYHGCRWRLTRVVGHCNGRAVSGSVDGVVRVWDRRKLDTPVAVLQTGGVPTALHLHEQVRHARPRAPVFAYLSSPFPIHGGSVGVQGLLVAGNHYEGHAPHSRSAAYLQRWKGDQLVFADNLRKPIWRLAADHSRVRTLPRLTSLGAPPHKGPQDGTSLT